MSFLGNYANTKVNGFVRGAVEALVAWDPKGASEAEIATMSDNLDRLGQEVAKADAAFKKSQVTYGALSAAKATQTRAAEILMQRLENLDPTQKASVEKSLNTLLTDMESKQPEIDLAQNDMTDAESFLKTLQASYAQMSEKLKTARNSLEQAQRDVRRAQAEAEQAKNRRQAADVAAGIVSEHTGIGVATTAMAKQADKYRQQAQADAMRTNALKPQSEGDDILAQALKEAKGEPQAQSLADRLAALKK